MVVSWVSSAFSEKLHTTKHVAHVCLLLIVVFLFEVGAGGLWGGTPTTAAYPPLVTLLFQLLRLLPLLALPQAVFNFLGFICFNAFPERAKLKGSPLLAPFLCLRVVTRGDYPDLVRTNVNRNLNTCLRVGLEKFMIEVVTDKKIDLPENQRIRQVVVPSSYRPKSGALFKARALQYCLEEDVNLLADTDWIVHLDEETLATEAAIRGILNFVIEGRHQFGQTGAERRVTFDHGPDGSVAEDNYFGMVALREGYSFDFIEGEMWEKSPFTIYDFLQQRKRWLQGILLVVHSPHIPVSTKWLLAVSLYSWITMPLALASVVLSTIFPVPVPGFINVVAAFVGAVNFYMYIFGVIKSFRVDRLGWLRMTMCVAGALITMPFNFLVENIAVVRGLVGNKHKFYIVDKVMGAPDKVVSTV